jgi:hypothetical protein
VNDKFVTWILKGHKDGVLPDGLSVKRLWISGPEGKEFDVLSIVAICDLVREIFLFFFLFLDVEIMLMVYRAKGHRVTSVQTMRT